MQQLFKIKIRHYVTHSCQMARTESVVVHQIQFLCHPVDQTKQKKEKQMQHEKCQAVSKDIKVAGDIQVLLFAKKNREANYQACCIVWYQLVR